MKTIFRSLNTGLLVALILALGAVATLAQDTTTPATPNPCTDADGQTKTRDSITEIFKDKSTEGLRKRIEIGKAAVEKYGACESFKDMADYLNKNIPTWEATLKTKMAGDDRNKLIQRFNSALDSKNWDESYVAGKEILAKYGEEFRTVEIVLGAIGGEEAFKNNFKYNEDALKYAKQSISDLEANKSFKVADKERFGLSKANVYNFEFANKEDALGWMNLYIGYITAVGKKDKVNALPYLYKATQATTSEASKNPVSFELIGSYYFDELNKIVEQIQIKSKDQKDTDTPEVAQQKVDDLKKLVAQSNGTSERAMDAFSRAFNLAKDPTVKAKYKKNVQDAYKLRFGKEDGVDAWIASAVAKPFIDPKTPIAPISDPEPAKTTGTVTGPGTGVGTANGTGMGAGNGSGMGTPSGSGMGMGNGNGVSGVKPVTGTTPVKNTTTTTTPKTTTPVKKPKASVKKATVKKTA